MSLSLVRYPASWPSYRLLVGLALSALAHAAVISGIRPLAVYSPTSTLLQVYLEQVAPEPEPLALARPAEPVAKTPAAVPVSTPEFKPTSSNAAPEPVAGLNFASALDRYYTAREVDVRAEPINDVDLVYPQLAYQLRIRGKVVLRIFINERGGIDNVSLVESQPPDVFDEAAVDATRALEFTPARRYGRNVKSQKTIEVVFDPYERIHLP